MLDAFFTYMTKEETDPAELEKEVRAAMREMDVNRDGVINFKEFLEYNLKMNGLVWQLLFSSKIQICNS